MRAVHVVLPNDIDDPGMSSGGNVYDRRICDGLAATGWIVREHAVPGPWPRPANEDRAALARVLEDLPDGAVVLLDGLVASAVPEVLRPQTARLRLVALVHMPLSDGAEGAALATARAVITPSSWTRRQLLDLYALPADKVHVATPGVDPAPLAARSAAGDRLICVAAVTKGKGHDLLAEALARTADRPWSCVCAGTLHRDPGFVRRICQRVREYGLDDRMRLVGPRTGGQLDALYAAGDLLVLPSRGETYGMVVTEALARGIPVLATAVGGVPEALGHAPDDSLPPDEARGIGPSQRLPPDEACGIGPSSQRLPGILVDADDPAALAAALRRWLSEPDLRRRLRHAARLRRDTLGTWAATSHLVSKTLEGVPA